MLSPTPSLYRHTRTYTHTKLPRTCARTGFIIPFTCRVTKIARKDDSIFFHKSKFDLWNRRTAAADSCSGWMASVCALTLEILYAKPALMQMLMNNLASAVWTLWPLPEKRRSRGRKRGLIKQIIMRISLSFSGAQSRTFKVDFPRHKSQTAVLGP